MEFFTSTQLSIPLIQVILLLILSTIVLLFGFPRLALLIFYCFTLYWGYVANMGMLTATELSKMTGYNFLYFGSGIVIILLAMIGLITHRE
jgi:hypothetical protein